MPPNADNDNNEDSASVIEIDKGLITKAITWIIGIVIVNLIGLLVWIVSASHDHNTRLSTIETKLANIVSKDDDSTNDLYKSVEKINEKIDSIISDISKIRLDGEKRRYEQLTTIINTLKSMQSSLPKIEYTPIESWSRSINPPKGKDPSILPLERLELQQRTYLKELENTIPKADSKK